MGQIERAKFYVWEFLKINTFGTGVIQMVSPYFSKFIAIATKMEINRCDIIIRLVDDF